MYQTKNPFLGFMTLVTLKNGNIKEILVPWTDVVVVVLQESWSDVDSVHTCLKQDLLFFRARDVYGFNQMDRKNGVSNTIYFYFLCS